MDAGFAAADYYDQHWQAGVWRDRVWMVPYAAEMRVLYYDALAYRRAGLTVPSSRWTWTEMLADVNTLSQRPPDDGIRFGVMSKTPDLLYAHAYSHGTGTLDSAQIRSTQAWYDELESQAGHAVPLQRESAERRDYLFRNFLNYPVRVAIWIDTPALYEHYLQYNPLGVAPFPATERFEAVTPLWVSGFAMLQSAENPTATWQWIKFASHFAPQPNLRLIPARPSTAAESGYWTTLPRQLADVMRPAFPSARAIAIDERDAFTWPD
jgi:ABC-type glycerol-3-phosphate transport system substrate-binding protein